MYCSNLIHASTNDHDQQVPQMGVKIKTSFNTSPRHFNKSISLSPKKSAIFAGVCFAGNLLSLSRGADFWVFEIGTSTQNGKDCLSSSHPISRGELLNFRGGNSYTPPLLKLPNKGHQRGNVHPMVDMTSMIYTTQPPEHQLPQTPKAQTLKRHFTNQPGERKA